MNVASSHRKAELKVLGPDSIVWRALSDWRILLCAGRSLLLQVAHPAVAAGVAQYSNFAVDPWKRIMGTLELYSGGVIFGWPDGSTAAAARLRSMHRRIKGLDTTGQPYHALEASAFHWVHATLVDGTAVLLEHFGKPLVGDDFARLYEEMRYVGRLCGLRDRDMPLDWVSFRDYFSHMVRSELEDNRIVREVIATLIRPPRPSNLPVPDYLWQACVWPPAGHLVMLCTIGLLPAPLRERLGLAWTQREELELRVHAALIRLVSLLPAYVRMHRYAYAAFRRAR